MIALAAGLMGGAIEQRPANLGHDASLKQIPGAVGTGISAPSG